MSVKIGVLALQGDFREHMWAVEKVGAEAVAVKRPAQLEDLAGLIIPGGESTTIGKLMGEYGFLEAIPERHRHGMAIYGTCAGAILLARDIVGSDQPRLGLMDMSVRRNAYGRQRESFEVLLDIPALGEDSFPAVFIRAPYIEAVYGSAEVLATYQGHIVMARQGRLLASSFHPELTEDTRVHAYFLDMAVSRGG